MRVPARRLLGALLLVLCASCSTTRIKSEGDKQFDYSRWKTFGWLPAKGEVAEGSPFWPDIQRMVTEALAAKGLKPARSGQPDVMVGFYAGIGVVSDVDWGYIYMPWFTTNPRLLNNDDFSKGVVVLDLMDAKTKQLVWRGGARKYVSETVQNKPDEMAAILRGLLPRILEGYPPR